MSPENLKIIANGLWTNNPVFVQVLGLCPLLAVTNTVINGLGLGLATLLTLVISNTLVSIFRNQIKAEIRLAVFVLIIAATVTVIELLMNAFWYELYLVLGIFVPLIVTNCAIIGRAEAFASKNTPGKAALDGLFMGLGFAAVLVVLGALREAIGSGTLFSQADLMFGPAAADFQITLVDDYRGLLIAILPPGAFFGLGFLIAIKNWIDTRIERNKAQQPTTRTIAEAQ